MTRISRVALAVLLTAGLAGAGMGAGGDPG